jgi:type 2 lantibiotic biosynthesis protein LanM
MNLSFVKTPTWYHATVLAERIALSHTFQHLASNEGNIDLAKKRLQCWRSQPPFTTNSFFAQRLAIDGISEEEFCYLLGEPIEAVRDRFTTPPSWLTEISEAFAIPSFTSDLPLEEPYDETAGFLVAIKPLIDQGRNRLRQGAHALTQMFPEPPFDLNTIEEILLASLPNQLIKLLSRTMVLELNVARLRCLLQGNTSKERFQSFLKRLCHQDIALAILQEYPVLARQLTTCIHNWVTFSLEFLQHLCADWKAICTIFSLEELGVLVQVESGIGDRHRGGKAVLIAKFSSGFQVVYKPRSLAVDLHFQELLAWLNARGDHPPFGTLKVLDRGTYGWTEFISARSCTSIEEVRRFYERQGGYLALLYALEAIDFHSENLIAVGEHPFLIDLETLFHQRIDIQEADLKRATQRAGISLHYSVLNTEFLPRRAWSNVDISGLGTVSGQLTPYGVAQWEEAGTDRMRLVRKQLEMSGDQNQPTLNGSEINVLNYIESITTGFANIYRLLLKHRDDLLSTNGPLAQFAEDEVRVVVRATRTYSALLHQSFHPDLLRNALDRDRLFDQLWLSIEHSPCLAKLIPFELKDLHNGDIPIFTTHPKSRDLWSSSNERIVDFFHEPGIVLVQRCIQQLSEANLMQQLWLIRASLATLSKGTDQMYRQIYNLTEPQTLASHDCLLAAAWTIGDRLEALALRGEHDVSWIGLTPTHEDQWSLAPLGVDLYAGMPGVALFLAYLGAVTHEKRYTQLAQVTLTTIRDQVECSRSFAKSIGAFTGWGGVIYTLAHLGTLWNETTLLAEAEALVELLPSLIGQDELLDIIAGAAGCIGSLLSFYHCTPSDRTLAVAIQCGDHLIAKAQSMEHGVGWVPIFGGKKPLTGFSHGAAGIAWALLELATVTGEERFRKAALDAIAYERSLFLPEMNNWPDLREFANAITTDNNQPTCMTAWCHGAPGIGLARLRCLQHLDDAKTCSEINAALKTTLAYGFGGNHSLCHGDLGNLELLLQASKILGDPQWQQQVDRFTAIILESINQHGWLCGIPLGVESPGLMTGLAGIGYQLLRLAEPNRVPSVLLLEPPILNTEKQMPLLKALRARPTHKTDCCQT